MKTILSQIKENLDKVEILLFGIDIYCFQALDKLKHIKRPTNKLIKKSDKLVDLLAQAEMLAWELKKEIPTTFYDETDN